MAAIFVATLVGYLLIQSSFQEAQTQTRDRTEASESDPSLSSSEAGEFAPDRIIVKLDEEATRADLEKLNEENNASTEKEIPRSQVNVVNLPSELPVGEAIERYEASPDVEYAEPDFLLKPSQTQVKTPDDPYYPKLWGLNNEGLDGGTKDADVDAPEAWSSTTGNVDTIVAVIDSGIDIDHPDLKNNIWVNTGEIPGNGVDDDDDGYVDDVNGWDFYHNDPTVYDSSDGDEHGTHIAGTIAAEGNNNTGVTGVNWRAKIMPLKVLGPNEAYTSDAVEALHYAVAKGAKISNNSWSLGSYYSQALLDAINSADAAGHLFVAGAGNGGLDADSTPQYPSGYDSPNIISVAATDNTDALASWSNYGAASVDLAAPGVGILSTLPNDAYGSRDGTSVATAHVAGVAALIKGKYPDLDYAQVKDRILRFVDKKTNLQSKTVSGGRLNAAHALRQSADETAPTVAKVSPQNGATSVSRTTEVAATFSEDMDETTLTTSTVRLYQTVAGKRGRVRYTHIPVDATASYDSATKTVTLTPKSALQPGAAYLAVITTGVTDKAGNALGQPYSWNFSTGTN